MVSKIALRTDERWRVFYDVGMTSTTEGFLELQSTNQRSSKCPQYSCSRRVNSFSDVAPSPLASEISSDHDHDPVPASSHPCRVSQHPQSFTAAAGRRPLHLDWHRHGVERDPSAERASLVHVERAIQPGRRQCRPVERTVCARKDGGGVWSSSALYRNLHE